MLLRTGVVLIDKHNGVRFRISRVEGNPKKYPTLYTTLWLEYAKDRTMERVVITKSLDTVPSGFTIEKIYTTKLYKVLNDIN